MAVNTTKSATAAKETAVKELEAQIKRAAEALKAEKLVKVSIPKALEKQLGPTLYLGLNGASIVLPVDGNTYEIPEPFKANLDHALNNL